MSRHVHWRVFNTKWAESGNIFGTSSEIFGKLCYLQKSSNNAQKRSYDLQTTIGQYSEILGLAIAQNTKRCSKGKKLLEIRKVAQKLSSFVIMVPWCYGMALNAFGHLSNDDSGINNHRYLYTLYREPSAKKIMKLNNIEYYQIRIV